MEGSQHGVLQSCQHARSHSDRKGVDRCRTTSFRAGRTLPTSDRPTTLRCWMAPRCTTSCERGCTRHELSYELSLCSLGVEEHIHLQARHMFSVARRITVVFKLFCCAAVVSLLLSRGSLELGWKRSHLWCADKHISVVLHLFQFFIHFTDTDGTVTLTTLASISPWLRRS